MHTTLSYHKLTFFADETRDAASSAAAAGDSAGAGKKARKRESADADDVSVKRIRVEDDEADAPVESVDTPAPVVDAQ